jgi:hypothetical protein
MTSASVVTGQKRLLWRKRAHHAPDAAADETGFEESVDNVIVSLLRFPA